MEKHDLQNNLVCYWQNGGWHGCNKIIRFNKKFVHYIEHAVQKDSKAHFISVKNFLYIHDIQISQCGYPEYHNDIGKVIGD